MSDRAIPRNLRMMEGFGVHSFRLVNGAGDSTFVKFRWRPKLGLQSTVWAEAVHRSVCRNRAGCVLLGKRLFSSLDTQLSRLGGPNFHQLPINAPKCPIANQLRDGHMQMQVPKGRVAYEPASLDAENARASQVKGTVHFSEKISGDKGRLRTIPFADHYGRARMLFRSQSGLEQAHLASALVSELSKVETEHVRLAVLARLQNVDAFAQLKAIAACKVTRLILTAGGITPDDGVLMPDETAAFLGRAMSREWAREPQVRAQA